MSENYLTTYQPLGENACDDYRSNEDDGSLENHPELLVHVVPDANKNRWNHVTDLDSFFSRLYEYHQSNGMLCMMLQTCFELFQFIFISCFTTFLYVGINYSVLFGYKKPDHEETKVSISDVIYPYEIAKSQFSGFLIIILLFSTLFWLWKVYQAGRKFVNFVEIKLFYNSILGIEDKQLGNVTWDEVQHRIMEVQVEQRMCIHKESLTELDIYHRILRFPNYIVAMVNKNLLPLKIQVPFWGPCVFMTRGLQTNLELLFFNFKSPCSPFKDNWHLADEYKRSENRHKLAEEMKKYMFYLGVANFVFWPLIFVWQLLNTFYDYTELIKREPGTLSLRRWSHYGEIYLRHFNELDHELKARLNRGYKAGAQYMKSFSDPLTVVIAKYFGFVCGSVFAVLFALTLYDEDVIQVEHILAIMTFLALIAAVCRSYIPDENLVYCPEILMTRILAEIHYVPEAWKGKAHTSAVREEFSQLFQSKVVHIIEELFSPLVTAYILCFKMNHRALDIVDFFRNFTVEVVGVGDICSFAQMDVRTHGSRTWQPDESELVRPLNVSERDGTKRTDGGKTELSLLHFTMTNPHWKPPQESSTFLTAVKTQAYKDYTALNTLPEENPLWSSMSSIGGGLGTIGTSVVGSPWMGIPSNSVMPQSYRGDGMNRIEGPSRQETSNGVLGSLSQSMSNSIPIIDPFLASTNYCDNSVMQSPSSQVPLDLATVDMNLSAVYLHELHHRRRARNNYTDQRPVLVVPVGRNSQNIQASALSITDSRTQNEPTYARFEVNQQTPLLRDT